MCAPAPAARRSPSPSATARCASFRRRADARKQLQKAVGRQQGQSAGGGRTKVALMSLKSAGVLAEDKGNQRTRNCPATSCRLPPAPPDCPCSPSPPPADSRQGQEA